MKKSFIPILFLCLVLVAAAVLFFRKTNTNSNNSNNAIQGRNTVLQIQNQVVSPVDRASERVTKKPFGIYITPRTSLVQPEKFTGFHTGTDFETFPEETGADVPFYSICAGKILTKRTATGYGGLFVQSCTINNEAVTVIYGHVKLSSIAKNVGDTLSQGEIIGLLGQPPAETSGERKHLHLGIHKGTSVDIRGYVQTQAELAAWLDF